MAAESICACGLSKGTHTWGAIFFSTNAQRAAVAQGDVVDIAFTPQINEYRSVRSVQLNLVDIRPDKAFREAQGHDRAVYKKHLAGGALSCDEAGCCCRRGRILPPSGGIWLRFRRTACCRKSSAA